MNELLKKILAINIGVLLLILLGSSTPPNEAPNEAYTFAIVPQFHSQSLFRIWNPILKELSKETGVKFKLTGNSSFVGFENDLSSGRYDFAYVNPYHAVMANSKQKYEAILSDADRNVRGILVVKKNSNGKVAALRGKNVAFPSPNTLASSILMRSELESKFSTQVRPQYLQTHTDVYMKVYQGSYAAGGGVQRTFDQLHPKIKNNLKVIYKTSPIPAHPIVVHPRVPANIRNKVIKAFEKLNKDPRTKALLSKIPAKNLKKTSQNVYARIAFTASL